MASRLSDGQRQEDEPGYEDAESSPLLQKTGQLKSDWSQRISQSFADWFAWEILSAAVAILSFVAIVIVLLKFDDSALPDWPSIFTINSIVSLFTSFSKICFMVIVGASVSQSKWLWYRKSPRPLTDLQSFDDASRGPWGAFSFVATFRSSSFASLGAVVVVLSLLYGPFTQQLVNYHDKLVPSGQGATIVRAQRYLAASYEGLPLPSVVDLSMKAAVYSGVFDARNSANSSTEFHCSTGDCSFDLFSSLAVCSSCANITRSIQTSGTKLVLPNGPSISGVGGQINVTTTKDPLGLEDIEASVLRFSSIRTKDTNDSSTAEAWECVLYYCVNEYNATVQSGDLHQEIRRSWRNDSATLNLEEDLTYRPPSSFANITYNASSTYVGYGAAQALNKFMSSSMTGSGGIRDNTTGSAFSSDITHALYETDDLPTRINNMVTSMSNNMRQQNNSGSSPLEGTALQTTTYLQVRWIWVVYPATVLFLSLCCLITTIIETERGKISVWKTSQIALLFHGQRLRLDKIGQVPASTMSTMTDQASKIEASLIHEGDQSWTLEQ